MRNRADGLFTSPLERRLWLLAGLGVAAILFTLLFASTLAGLVGDSPADVVFVVGMLVMVLAIIIQSIGSGRAALVTLGAGVGVLAAYVLVFARLTTTAERSHLLEYGVLAALIYLALLERTKNGRGPSGPGLVALAVASMVGLADELVQAVIPFRVFDPYDILFNVAASFMAVAAIAITRWVRARRS